MNYYEKTAMEKPKIKELYEKITNYNFTDDTTKKEILEKLKLNEITIHTTNMNGFGADLSSYTEIQIGDFSKYSIIIKLYDDDCFQKILLRSNIDGKVVHIEDI